MKVTLSRAHSKVLPGSLEEKVKVASSAELMSGGAVSMLVTGASASIVNCRVSETSLPRESVA